MVKHFDGDNDGLVSVESAKWGERFTLLSPTGKRGISHGDVIDLNRENIDGFDVCEIYVELLHDLQQRSKMPEKAAKKRPLGALFDVYKKFPVAAWLFACKMGKNRLQ